MDLPAGHALGAFRILEKIGKGAMGTVYRARQPALERDVALKVLNASHEPRAYAHLHEEAIRVAQLRHPSILPVFDFGQQDDIAYIAMQLADGGTLASRMSRPMDPAEAVKVLRPVAQAIDYAHDASVIHRDVKPANMLFDGGRIFLSDFGLALMRDASTTTGQMVGTPWYMAPEQFRGRAEPASDIYALAATLFQMLTGHLPYERETALAVMLAHLKDPIPSARDWNPDLPEAVDRVLRRGMAKDPMARFDRAMQLLAAVHAMQRDQPAVRQVPAAPIQPAPQPAATSNRLAATAPSNGKAGSVPQPKLAAAASSPSAASSMASTIVAAPARVSPQAPARGRLIFESQPSFSWAKANIVLGDPRNDTLRIKGDLIAVSLSQRSQAHVMLPVGVLNDFIAELQFGPAPNSGWFDLMFHEGASHLAHCVRLDPARGQISIGNIHAARADGERWFAARGIGLDPAVQHKLLIVVNKASIEAYLDGKGVVAASDQTLSWGMLRLQMVPSPSKPASVLLFHHVSIYRLPD